MEKVKPWLGEPQNTIAVLQKYGFVFQKKYGQNFLIDPHVLDKIVAAAGIGPDDFVVEIGSRFWRIRCRIMIMLRLSTMMF